MPKSLLIEINFMSFKTIPGDDALSIGSSPNARHRVFGLNAIVILARKNTFNLMSNKLL